MPSKLLQVRGTGTPPFNTAEWRDLSPPKEHLRGVNPQLLKSLSWGVTPAPGESVSFSECYLLSRAVPGVLSFKDPLGTHGRILLLSWESYLSKTSLNLGNILVPFCIWAFRVSQEGLLASLVMVWESPPPQIRTTNLQRMQLTKSGLLSS